MLILPLTRLFAQRVNKIALALAVISMCVARRAGAERRRGDGALRLSDGRHIVVGATGRMLNLLSKRHFRIDDSLTCVSFSCESFGSQIYDTPPLVSRAIAAASLAVVEEKSSYACNERYTCGSPGASFVGGACR